MIGYLQGDDPAAGKGPYPQTFRDRLAWKHPYPLLRHWPAATVEATAAGIAEIAAAGVIDVISWAPTRTPRSTSSTERQDPRRRGRGGRPGALRGRTSGASRKTGQGNHLLRTYAGTTDLLRLAELYQETIRNAWCAVPSSGSTPWTGGGRCPSKSRSGPAGDHGLARERDIPVG